MAWCSWLVRTGLRGSSRAAIKWRMAVVYASLEREAIKESVVRESTETHSRIEDGKWRWQTNSIRSSAMSDVFIVLFIFLAHFSLVICKSDPHLHYSACLLQLVHLQFCLTHSIFSFKLEQCASYRGSRHILSRRQHAPNKRCVLNNDVRLITWFYGFSRYYASLADSYTDRRKKESQNIDDLPVLAIRQSGTSAMLSSKVNSPIAHGSTW